MTFEETKQLLRTLWSRRKQVDAIQERIDLFRKDYGSIQSMLGGDVVSGGVFTSKVETLALRVLAEQDKYMKALERYFEIEDKLKDAIDELTGEEQEIIIESYMQGYPDWKIGQNVGYCREQVNRIKVKAIRKLSRKL